MSGRLQFLKCVYNYSYCIVRYYVVGGCDYSRLYWELYCVWVECCYVVGGCDYSQLYRELYCVWVECCYVVGGCDYSQLYRELLCVGRMVQWIIMNQWSDDTRILY